MDEDLSRLEQSMAHGFNRGIHPVPILAAPQPALLNLGRDELKYLIAQHYAKIRPTSLDISGRVVLENELYGVNYAAGILFLTPQSLHALESKGRLHLEKKDKNDRGNRLSGYEIIRLWLRPKNEVATIDTLCNRFYISREIAKRLTDPDLDILQKIQKGEKLRPLKKQLKNFFDEVFPVYAGPGYYALKKLPENPLLTHMPYAALQK